MPHFDKKLMRKKVEELQLDVESGELTTTAWLWIIGGGLVGLAASCLKMTRKGTEPILAKFNRFKKSGGLK